LEQVPEGAYREGAAAAFRIIFTTLRERGDQVVWFAIALAVVAYLVGPGRWPTWLRRNVRAGARAAWSWGRGLATGSESSAWVRERLDGLRIGGVVVAGVVALLLSSWGSLLAVLVLLGAYELAITLIAGTRPEAAGVPAEAGAEEQAPAGPRGEAEPQQPEEKKEAVTATGAGSKPSSTS
jgi:hypothetical protein